MNKKTPSGNARLAAVNAVAAVLDDDQTLAAHFQSRTGLSPRDEAFARHLAYGVIRWLTALEWISAQLVTRPIKKKEKAIQRLILIGLFQLWKDETADHAAVHATAECARDLGKHWAVGLVNAVLRRFQREQVELTSKLASTDQQFAHPDWLLSRIRNDWPDRWQEIVSENNRQAPLWLRLNRQRAEMESAISDLNAAEFSVKRHSVATDALAVEPAAPVQRLPGFLSGGLSVQDPAAQLAADYIDPQAGDRVLDACAAPGGKTCHLLERQPGLDLLALDRDGDRIELIRENLERLGLECRLLTADASDTDKWWDGKPFDKILLDAPCSTTGVIRRHPEIKWLRDPSQVERAIADQKLLLEQLWPLLNAGGILVYATCSILKSENHEQIHGFLSRHPEAELCGPLKTPGQAAFTDLQVLPGEDGMDGFYYAVIRKHT